MPIPSAKRKPRAVPPPEPRLSRQRRPEPMDAADWQRALRRQFGREQGFELKNLGSEPFFSVFRVSNPAAKSSYRITVRGLHPGENRCTCADFASNDLGTCKHIEFALHKLMKRRGAKVAFARGWLPEASEVWLHHGTQRSVRFRAAPDAPRRLLDRARVLFDQAGDAVDHSRLGELDAFVAAAHGAGHALVVDEDALAFVAQIRDAAAREAMLAAACAGDSARADASPGAAASEPLAGLLKTRLYPYQAEGALFAARAGRALIADEMGLGKTVQAIAAAELMARHFGVEHVLVICPASLKYQWQREFARFSGRAAQVIGGPLAERQRQWRDDAFCKIVNYDRLHSDLELIDAWAPELMIVDEAQRVKNWNTVAARAIRRIGAPYAVVLTGTPLENRLEELIAIVQLVDQHRLGPTWQLRERHQIADKTGRVIGYRDLDQLGATLAPVMLRRRKADVLDQLPERVDKTLFVPLTREQARHHEENGLIVNRIVKRWRKTGFLSDADQRRLTCALQNMRMSCNSTWLLDHETDHGTKADELMLWLEDLLEDPAAKAVVFSQWLGTHEVIARRLAARGWDHVLFSGSVPTEQRGALVDRFHDDPACRLFLSTDAGGVGLNLQHAAAAVVNMDMPWNPAVLEQRIGRVHRLGQRRGVQVLNLVAQASIEENMLSLLDFKKSLFAGVLDGGDAQVFLKGGRLGQFMEAVDQATSNVGTVRVAAAEDAGDRRTAVRNDAGELAEPDIAVAAALDSGPQAGTVAAEHRDEVDDAMARTFAAAGASSTDAPPRELASVAAGVETLGAEQPQARPADPWARLLDAGVELIEGLAGAADGDDAKAHPWLHVDAASGRRELRLPLPDPQTLQRLAAGLSKFLAGRGQ